MPRRSAPRAAIPPLVVVRFRRGTDVGPLDGDRTVDPATLGKWSDILREFPTARMRAVFDGPGLDTWRRAAEIGRARAVAAGRSDPGPADLGFESLFYVTADLHHRRLAARLQRWPNVERAWVRRGARSPSVALPAPGRWEDQGHLDASTAAHPIGARCGVGARAVWESGGAPIAGAEGKGVRVVVVDLGCFTPHLDFDPLRWFARLVAAPDSHASAGWPALLTGQQFVDTSSGAPYQHVQHGTAMLSLVCARPGTFNRRLDGKDFGCVGVAPGVERFGVASTWRRPSGLDLGEYLDLTLRDIAGMLDPAEPDARRLRAGDVVLIERQFTANADKEAQPEPEAGRPYVPVEADEAVREQIDVLTDAGLVVVEAGSNHALDLDTYASVVTGEVVIDARPSKEESAILVSHAPYQHGSAAANRLPHARADDAVRGERVDCWGPGESVAGAWAADVSPAPTDDPGYASVHGSSPAAAVVAGVVASMQGTRREAQKGVLDAPAVRRLLRLARNGTAWDVPDGELVRHMPDLAKLTGGGLLGPVLSFLDLTRLADGEMRRLRALIERSGQPPPAPPPGPTPDPWFVPGADYTFRTLVLNLGADPCTEAFVTNYLAPAVTVATPDTWTLVGTTNAVAVPAGGEALAGPLAWTAAGLTRPVRRAVAAALGTARDRIPTPDSLTTWDAFLRARRDGSIGVRFVASVPQAEMGRTAADARALLDFQVSGAADEEHEFSVRIESRLPAGAEVHLVADRAVLDVLRGRSRKPSAATPAAKRQVEIPLLAAAWGRARIPAKSQLPAALRVWIPPAARAAWHRIDVVQTWKGEEVGRLTWLFAPA